MEKKDRVFWIDTLKCIGMFFIVLGHTTTENSNDSFRFYVYSFHVPLFFIVSGMSFYLQTSSKFYTWTEMLINKIKGLMIPFYILSFLTLLIWILLYKIISFQETSILEPIFGILYSNATFISSPSNALWFLPTLFVTTMVFFALIKWSRNDDRLLTLIVLAITSFGYTMSFRPDKFPLPWRLDTVFIALLFVFVGYLFMKNFDTIKEFLYSKRKQLIICIVMFPILYCFARYNVKISMATNTYGSFLHFLITSFGFTYICIVLAINLQKFGILNFIGRNTLVYLAFHTVLFRFMKVYSDNTAEIFNEYPFIFGMISFIILIPIAYIFERWLPFLIGRKKNKKN